MSPGGNFTTSGGNYTTSVTLAGAVQAVSKQSLSANAGTLVDRLGDLHQRLVKIGDLLFGPSPRDAGAPAQPEPMPSAQRWIDRSHDLISAIQAEVSSIESRL